MKQYLAENCGYLNEFNKYSDYFYLNETRFKELNKAEVRCKYRNYSKWFEVIKDFYYKGKYLNSPMRFNLIKFNIIKGQRNMCKNTCPN